MYRYTRSLSDPRRNTNLLQEMLDDGLVSIETVLQEALLALSDEQVGELIHDLGLDSDLYEEEE